LAFLLIISSISYSKTISDYGIKIGMVSSQFKIKPTDPRINFTLINHRRIGPTIGVYARYQEMNHFDFESGLYYIQKGGKEKMEITTILQPAGTGETLVFDVQFDYLQFQTSFRPYIKSKGMSFYTLIGGTMDYLIWAGNTNTPRSNLKNFVFGYAIGTGFEFYNILNKVILVEVLLTDTKSIFKNSNIKTKTNSYLIRLGFSLDGSHK
jgi:hypothetical protein